MDMPLISVIVPVYKTRRYLRQCVDSIRSQSYVNLFALDYHISGTVKVIFFFENKTAVFQRIMINTARFFTRAKI